jgi:hypothetical protein
MTYLAVERGGAMHSISWPQKCLTKSSTILGTLLNLSFFPLF